MTCPYSPNRIIYKPDYILFIDRVYAFYEAHPQRLLRSVYSCIDLPTAKRNKITIIILGAINFSSHDVDSIKRESDLAAVKNNNNNIIESPS